MNLSFLNNIFKKDKQGTAGTKPKKVQIDDSQQAQAKQQKQSQVQQKEEQQAEKKSSLSSLYPALAVLVAVLVFFAVKNFVLSGNKQSVNTAETTTAETGQKSAVFETEKVSSAENTVVSKSNKSSESKPAAAGSKSEAKTVEVKLDEQPEEEQVEEKQVKQAAVETKTAANTNVQTNAQASVRVRENTVYRQRKNVSKAPAVTFTEPADVFKDFYINKLDELISEKQKELNELSAQIENLKQTIAMMNNLAAQKVAQSVQIQKKNGTVKKVEITLPSVKVFGVSCEGDECVAYTDLGVISKGDKLDRYETVIKITNSEIVTNRRVIKF